MKRKRRSKPRREDSPAQIEKEAADFMGYVRDQGWSFKQMNGAGVAVYGNASGEEKPLAALIEDYALALSNGYQPVNKEFLRLAADEVVKKFPDGWGFILIAAPLGQNGHTTYTSNVDRVGALKLLKKLLFHWGEEENWMKHIG